MEYRPSFLDPSLWHPPVKAPDGSATAYNETLVDLNSPTSTKWTGFIRTVALNAPHDYDTQLRHGFLKRGYRRSIIRPGTVLVTMQVAGVDMEIRDDRYGNLVQIANGATVSLVSGYINYVTGLIYVQIDAAATNGLCAYDLMGGGMGWLRNGLVIPAWLLRSELDYLVRALNSIASQLPGGTENAVKDLDFQAGRQVNYAEKNSYNREQVLAWSSGSDQLAVDLDALAKSDTAFNTITLDPASQAYGCRAMRLGLTFSATLSAGSIRHPSHASRAAASEFVIRDAGDRADVVISSSVTVPKESVGEHVLAVGDTVDTTSAILATFTDMIEVDLRNFNNSFTIRVGTGLTFGANSTMGVKILEVFH